MDVKVQGQVWLAGDWVYISNFRDYSKVLQEARKLNPLVKVRAVEPDEVPAGAEKVI